MTRGIVEVKVVKGYDSEKITRSIGKIDGVRDLYEVTGDYDIVAIFDNKDMDSLNSSIDKVRKTSGVIDTLTTIVLKEYGVGKKSK